MIARLRTHQMVLIGLGGALAAVAACSGPEVTSQETDAKKTTQASSVVVTIVGTNGQNLGSCSGTLLAPRLVLTAGHCIAGASRWQVRNSVGASEATIASTPWKKFGSDLSHPEHSDVGLILLDSEIELDDYPQVAAEKVKDASTGVRYHRASASASEPTATSTRIQDGRDKGFRVNYLLEVPDGEWLDTGGAVLDAAGKIVGVVSGKGRQSGLLHVARVDGFATWMKSAVGCSSGLTTRTWGSGNRENGGGGYGGTPEDGESGGWGGGGWSSSGGYGGGGKGKGGGAMDGGATVPGSSGSNGSSGSSGSTGDGSGSGGTPGDGGNGGADGSNGGSDTSCPGTPVCKGDDCGSGSNGNNGGSGGNDGNGGDDGTGGNPGGDGEGCSGSGDNPEVCPPEPESASCNGPNCGGCSGKSPCSDSNLDYGSCPSCTGSSGAPILR